MGSAIKVDLVPPHMSRGPSKKSLAQQYGGMHAGSWVDALPASWVPYVQLSRLSPPAGLFIIFFPHCFGVLHAASVHGQVAAHVSRVCLVLLIGSFFCNNASHAWNDLVDAPIDRRIARTRSRPIPRGAITPQAAFVFTVSQAVCAAACLLLLPMDTAKATIPTIVGTVYYPYAKRHLPCPQLVLGFCLTWGIMVGSSAMGVPEPWTDMSTVLLTIASILWVVIFDTIYAHQDVVDDRKTGVKSTAVLFGSYTRPILWVLFLCMSICLGVSGYIAGMGLPYFTLSVGGCVKSVGFMIAKVDLGNPSSCWLWFSKGFWITGAAISGGLLAEYVLTLNLL